MVFYTRSKVVITNFSTWQVDMSIFVGRCFYA